MHKISNFTGQARHGWERMTPSMGFGRQHDHNGSLPNKRTGNGSTDSLNPNLSGHFINLSFNVLFNSQLAGVDKEDVLFSSVGAFQRWTHPDDAPEDTPTYALPIHTRNVENLRSLCKQISETYGDRIQATVTSSRPKPVPGMQRGPLTALVTNVCISGDAHLVTQQRKRILNETPITLQTAFIDVDRDLIFPKGQDAVRADVLNHMDEVADQTKADIFLLAPKARRKDSDPVQLHTALLETGLDDRLRLQVYGDIESCENAKTRLLIMIDQLLQRQVDTIRLELSLHSLISGRHRRNIKQIESQTGTAIYFPPLFPSVFGYSAPGSQPLRQTDEIILTGESMEKIMQAKKKLHDLVYNTKTFVKDVLVTASKVDYLLLERLDKIRKIIEANGSYVLLPPLGSASGILRVQSTDILNVERTVREIMGLAGQFYSAQWWVTNQDPAQRQPTLTDIRAMLSDICINSGAEITFEQLNFHINGSDDSVKAAMSIINSLPFVRKAQNTLRVKVELANEHKEFVSGKKNGKINKIMSQSNVQIVFDGFNEYNFYIDVRGAQYEATKSGLELVELEMPASISFHVPDTYHKRIIGIGGQHIQRIMKKYSVFVKFSNAMDRGGLGKEDDDIKVDNVICRTPARNADNLELVKQEIMDMVEKPDADFVSEQVPVNRLYHRELIARMPEIDTLEKKWNCKVTFPGTEQASDIITISGPQWQVPQARDEFLGMVPVSHEIQFPTTEKLRAFLTSPDFITELVTKMKEQHEVLVTLAEPVREQDGDKEIVYEKLKLSYTLNNAEGIKDAVDFMLLPLIANGLEASTIRGALPGPKSDSFQDNLQIFGSKILQPAEQSVLADPATRTGLADDVESRSFFGKFRKPSSIGSFGSFLERRKNGSNSPGSLFKHASSNASKASLVSMESRESGYRNPWNDSGIDLEHDNAMNGHASGHGHGWGSFGGSASRPNTSSNSLSGTFETKFPFGASGNASSTSLSMPLIPGLGMVNGNGVHTPGIVAGGDVTPKNDSSRSVDGDHALSRVNTASARPESSSAADSIPEATANEESTATTIKSTTSGSAANQDTQGYPRTQPESQH